MMGKDIEVRDIVADWLQKKGFDGLYDPGCCACEIGDLMPCDNPNHGCVAGYKVMKKDSDECEADWHMTSNKENFECNGGCGV